MMYIVYRTMHSSLKVSIQSVGKLSGQRTVYNRLKKLKTATHPPSPQIWARDLRSHVKVSSLNLRMQRTSRPRRRSSRAIITNGQFCRRTARG